MVAEFERCIVFACYSICLVVSMAIPYNNCDIHGCKSVYTFDYKTWSVVFILICMIHLMKESCFELFNRWHQRDTITFQTRNRLRQIIAIGFELMHICWQIYGNFIFFEWRGKNDKSDEEFSKCMEK